MAKRFHDSRKYHDPWFRKLPPTYKLLWDYILSTCNHAGIWKVDMDMAEFCIGLELNQDVALEVFNGRVKSINSGEWFIPKFIAFQYGGQLKSGKFTFAKGSNAFKSVLQTLEDKGLIDILREYLPTVPEQFPNSSPTVMTETEVETETKAEVEAAEKTEDYEKEFKKHLIKKDKEMRDK